MGSNPSMERNYKSAMNSKDKMQMLCMKNGTTAEGYNRRREPRNSSTAQLNLQRMVATSVCTSIRKLPAHLYTTPEYQMNQTAQPAVAQLMNCGS
ncbi:hypothetical protein F511_29989 [Dorcoceras hygrometricum]|uniref:Uncharacterized protein n=1 Tax=Dorcoceras hygrometricum TaxID=472368 RepID=A0A2Z7C484_9LAMI|nr:hypothetical protein F511_29989 [Dorcoceras hygrometricum]